MEELGAVVVDFESKGVNELLGLGILVGLLIEGDFDDLDAVRGRFQCGARPHRPPFGECLTISKPFQVESLTGEFVEASGAPLLKWVRFNDGGSRTFFGLIRHLSLSGDRLVSTGVRRDMEFSG